MLPSAQSRMVGGSFSATTGGAGVEVDFFFVVEQTNGYDAWRWMKMWITN